MVEGMMMVVAMATPMEKLVKDLVEAGNIYLSTQSEEAKINLHFASGMFMLKLKIESDGGDIMKTMKEFEASKRGAELLNTGREKLS